MSNSLVILSLDISTVSTGWCLYKNDIIFGYGAIKIKDTIDIHERMVILRNKIEELLKEHQPSVVIVEDVWVGNNPKTAKLLAKFCGVAEEVSCRTLHIKPTVIENTKVKKFFKCKNKEILFNFILDILELDSEIFSFKENNDSIDAVAQLFCYLHLNEKKTIRVDKDYGYLYKFED